MRYLAAALCILAAAACEHRNGEPAVQAKRPEPSTLAEDVLRLELETQGLRPMARALAGRSFRENSVDALESHLAVTAALLLEDEGRLEGDRRRATEIGLSAAGLDYDLMRTDMESAARGMSAIPRYNCNRGVEEIAKIREQMAKDWRWAVTHGAEAEEALAKAEGYRDNVMGVMPVANVMKAGVAAASMTSTAISLAKLATLGQPALSALIQWMKAGGVEGASLELVGAGAGLAVRAVAGTQVLVLTDAAVIALAQAGQIAANSIALLYMARGHLHHICTDKNWESDVRGGPWSPRFKRILDGAKVKFDDPENLVEVQGHQGPHPEAYHQMAFDALQSATDGLAPGSEAYRAGVLRTLRSLAEKVRTPGTRLNRLVTGAAR